MRRLIQRFCSVVDRLSFWEAIIAALMVGGMTVLVGYGVMMRYLRKPTFPIDEPVAFMLVGVSFLGLAYALREGSHVTADIVVSRLGRQARRVLYCITSLVGLGYLGALVWSARWLVLDSYSLRALSPSSLHFPLFIPQLFILVGVGLFGVQLLVELQRTLGITRKKDGKGG